MNIRDETRHDIHKSAALRYALLCIVTRLISDVHFLITGQKLTFNSYMNNIFDYLQYIIIDQFVITRGAKLHVG